MRASESSAPERHEVSTGIGQLTDSRIHVPVLDGVRGLAIALVMLFHFTALAHTPTTFFFDNAATKVTASGWMGVDLFLVLSGFLITGILYDSKYTYGYLSKFYARRILRIFPLYFTFLFFMLLLVDVARIDDTVPRLHDSLPWFAAFLGNFNVALESSHAGGLPVTAHLWSVAVEEQFYLVWPAIVMLCSRRWLVPVCVFAIATALLIRTALSLSDANVWFGYTLMPARMDALAIGALIALLAREPNALRRLVRWAPVAGLAALAVVAALGVHATAMFPFDLWTRTLGYTAIAVMFGALLVAAANAAPSTVIHRFFTNRFMRALGRYSYALYLIHVPVSYFLSQHTEIGDKFPTVLGSSLLGEAAFVIVAFILTFTIARLSWLLIEGPSLRLKRYFSYTSGGQTKAGATRTVPVLAAGD